jgi:murein L,D-transpeptidase YafK
MKRFGILSGVMLGLLVLTQITRAEEDEAAAPGAQPALPAYASPLAAAFERAGLRLGAPVFLRIYKEQSVVELWVAQGPRYTLFKRYPVCAWSGGLGPKLAEGDLQSPEGYYYIRPSAMIVNLRWHRAMNLRFPNAYDMAHGRTGSGILIHGKCSSVGCFALTDAKVEELYEAVEAALNEGQSRVPVLILPFPMTNANIARHGGVDWLPFWRELKRADDLFERDRVPPVALLCGTSYHFTDRRRDGRRGQRVEALPANCRPLSRPLPPQLVASARPRSSNIVPVVAGLSPREAAELEARTCNPRATRCRQLRVALGSSAICPKKYARCRTAEAAITKSIDCPLKYPRCRRGGRIRPAVTPVSAGRGEIARERRAARR